MSQLLYSTIRKGRLALALALLGLLSQGPVAANPLHPVVAQGSASFSTQGPQLTIHTGNNALINWSSFNIGAGETTTFVQPSSTSLVWNHISDPNPTQILGHLDANGYVVLQNQSGFYIGGNAVINAAGLLMTTTPTVPMDVFEGGAWSFSAPPPTASIINYGEINAGPGGSVFLISHDIQNNGTITAPGGNIGLCAGEQVLMSTRADGRGVSATVTLPEGSVDNSGKLIADAGTIALNAQVVNQGGLIQANSVRNENGVVEIVASDAVNLGAGSTISAKGDTQGASAGGQVTIKSGNAYSDTASSLIDVSGGVQGGNGGQVEISATELNAIQSQVNGHANEGWVGGKMTIDPANILIGATGTGTTVNGTVAEGSNPGTTLQLSTTYLNGFSQIDLQASQNITLTAPWNVPDSTSAATLTLQAGNNIVFAASGDSLTVGKNWSVNLIAGANFNTLTGVTPNSKSGSSSIVLNGNAGVQSANGSINLIAGGNIVQTTGTIQSTDGGSILMQAYAQNIILSGTQWALPASPTPASLTLQAGNNIIFSSTTGEILTLGQNWSVNMVAGATFVTPTSVIANALSADNSIVMNGSTGVQSANGSINLIAGNSIVMTKGTIESTDGGSILLQSISPTQSIALGGTQWNLPDSATPASVTLQAGGNISLGGGIEAGQNWDINLVAGATFASPTSVNTKDIGSVTVGSGFLQTQNGNIDVTTGGGVSIASGSFHTLGGGNIDVDAVGGSVNTGNDASGYTFRTGGDSVNLGGISTAAGGNVTITAGGDVTSFLPTGTTTSPTDAGSGAFGPEPGVVTITAGGNVYGHYVAADSEANGVVVPSTITALNGNAGSAASASDYLALSLVTGSWVVNAPNGSINLQEVRNPNGALNAFGIGAAAAQNNVFNYAPDASVTLNAGNAVNLLGLDLPRDSGFLVPCIYPPILTINAGPGGVSLDNNVTLFPSPQGELTVNTTVPAGTAPNAPGTPPPGSFEGNGFTLAMSDSGATRWIGAGATGATDFANDHAATPIQLNNSQPVVFNIAGDLDDVTLISPKATQVMVGGSMNNVSFTGQNLHNSDTTFFHVAGQIFEQNTYAFVSLSTPLTLPAPLYPNAIPDYLQLLENAVVPGSGPTSAGAGALFPSLNIFYLPGTQQLGYNGIMTPAIEALLLGPLQEKTYTLAGKVLLDTQGNYVTTTASFAANSGGTLSQAIQALYAASQNSVNLANAPQGLVIGGPGQLDITAQSMNLGVAADGISSVGPAFNNALAKIATQGAAIKINLTGDLDMFASHISSWYGGAIDINVGGAVNDGLANLPFQQPGVPHGIWTSDDSGISVIAQGNINIDGSRIATYDGGNIDVESLQGNVDAGSGSVNSVQVNEVLVNPKTGTVTTPQQQMAGSGILATTLPDAPHSLEVGNITVSAPKGDIDASVGGITQEPKNGNSSLAPTVNLTAGGNINASGTGVIGINVNAQATGAITGLFISSGNSTIHSDSSVDATVLAGGTASVNSGGTITGLFIAGGGINIGSGSFQGVALSQNVSGGGAQSGLASAASASAGSQTSAAGEASSQKAETSDQLASSDTDDDLKRARGRPLLAKYTGRVTVLLPPKR